MVPPYVTPGTNPSSFHHIPDTTNGTAIGLPPHWGGARGVWLGRQSGLAVP